MCSRILYETEEGTYIVGRGMDWRDPTAATELWIFPKGMKRDGGAGDNPIEWIPKYGSMVASFYSAGTADGMNEEGMVVNLLYLSESKYGDPTQTDKPTLSIGAWGQYMLDNYATVNEAVDAMQDPPFAIISPLMPNGMPSTAHLSLSDPSGDSAVFEYLDGELVLHHGRDCKVMTNSPVYDQQIALNAYWDLIGGHNMLPGTTSSADRFVRLSYNLKSSPTYKERKKSVASVFSQMRAIGVPLGMMHPDLPNISSTLWRTVADHDAKRYYFESTLKPAIYWVDLEKCDFSKGADVKRLDCDSPEIYFGEVSAKFEKAEPFEFLS